MTAAGRTPDPMTAMATRLLATTGVGLLLAAAVSLVSARWELFGPGPRLGLLLGASAVLVMTTHRLRRLAPSTARSLDVLIAAMVPINTAAAVIVSGGDWRVALVAAGPMAVATGAGLRHRGMLAVADVAVVIGGVLTASGLAAQYDLHGPLLLAGSALAGTTALDRPLLRVPIVAALTAGFVPVARLFDEVAFTGMGTLRELGLIDPVELPVALTTGVISAGTLIVAAFRARSGFVALGATAVAVITGFELWAIAEPPAEIGLLALTAGFALIELADPRRWPLSAEAVEAVETVNTIALAIMTALMGTAAWSAFIGQPVALSDTPLIGAVAAAGWMFGELRRPEPWFPSAPGLLASVAAAAYLATVETTVLAATLLVCGLALGLLRRPGHHVLGGGVAAVAPLVGFVDAPGDTIALLASASAIAVVIVARHRGDDPSFSAAAMIVTLVHGLIVGFATGSVADLAMAALAVSAVWTVAGLVVRRVNPPAAVTLRLLALAGPPLAADARPWLAAAAAATLLAMTSAQYVRRPSSARLALVGAAAVGGYVTILRAVDATLLDAYLVPVIWGAVVAAVWSGAPSSALVRLGLLASVIVGVGGRLENDDLVHTAILGLVAVGVAVWAARSSDRPTLVVSCPTAVAVAAFDVLDRSVGIEGWSWLVVGGAAAITAAAVLERQGREPLPDASVR